MYWKVHSEQVDQWNENSKELEANKNNGLIEVFNQEEKQPEFFKGHKKKKKHWKKYLKFKVRIFWELQWKDLTDNKDDVEITYAERDKNRKRDFLSIC